LVIYNYLMTASFRIKAILLLCLLGSALYVSAQTANINAGCAPMTVNFTAPGSASAWYWDFMDGASSNLQNPSNTYTTPGTYVVEFRQTTTGPLLGTVTITVFPKPVPQIITTSPLQGCTPLTVALQGSAITPAGVIITGYEWAFGEGSGATGQNTGFTYTVPGTYNLALELTTNFPTCNVTAIFPDYISTSNPTANFNTTPNPAFSCTAPLTVAFTNTSISTLPLTYAWNMGNSNTYTTQNPLAQTYTADGLYPVMLEITDTNGCVKTVTKNVSIGVPVANFNAPDSVCLNAEVHFASISSPGLHQWTFGPDAAPVTSTLINPVVTYSTPGTKNVHLVVTAPNGQCTKDTTIAILVEDPSFTINSDPGYSCQSPTMINYSITTTANIAEWDWTFNDGKTDSIANPSHLYELWDTTFYRREVQYLTTDLTIVTTTGCTFTASVIDTIYPVFARFMPDIADGCGPLTVTFSDSSLSNEPLVTWHYDYGDNTQQTLNSDAPHTHVFNAPGVYPVVLTATNAAGCFDISDTIFIEVGGLVAIDFSAAPLSVCPGESISFTNLLPNTQVDAWNFSTDGELLSHCFNDQNPTMTFDDTTGLFSVTLTAIYNGCTTQVTKSDYVTVKGPIAKFNYLYDCSAPLDVQFKNQSMGATSTSWVLGDGNTHAAAGNFTHSYAASGNYEVILTASNATSGCADSKDTFLLPVHTIEAHFAIDDSYCGGTGHIFDASPSVDVYADCYRGYTWMFENPSLRPLTTDDPSPLLTFPSSGLQHVTLIVTDINGCKDTLTQEIRVYNVNAVYTMDVSTICLPGNVNFDESSTSDTTLASWSWNFGDQTSATVQDPSHAYAVDAGTDEIPVTLIVTDILGCADTVTQTFSIYTPVSNITSPGFFANFCAGTPITFNATDSTISNFIFSWDFDDGTPVASTNPATHTYLNGGSYTVEVHFEEISSGCEGKATKVVNIQNYPVADFDGIGDEALCNPVAIAFTNTSVSTVPLTTQWTFDPGQTTLINNPTFTFTTGDYTAELIVSTSYGCTDTLMRPFKVLGPAGDFTFTPQTICRGDDITFTLADTSDIVGYEWDFGDGLDSANMSPVTHTYNFIPPSGQTVAKLTLFGDADGSCPVTVEQTVFIREVRALFDRNDELDTALCLGELLQLTNNSMNATVYNWNFGDSNTSSSTALSFDHTYTTADTFSISLAVYNPTFGCRDTIIKQVIIHPLPEVSAVGDTVCLGTQGQLHAFSPDVSIQWSWSPATGLNDPAIADPLVNVDETMPYTVTGFNTLTECGSTAAAEFIVIQPLEDIFFDTAMVVGDYINFPVSNQDGFVLFQWTPETGLSCTDCSNPQVQGLEEITYTLFMTDTLGCSTADGTFIIKIRPETFIDLPTTFTPNGDGVNDIIYVKGWGIKELDFFQIYNRWGELVFETTNEAEGWNGYYKGMLQNNGTYTYKVRATSWKNQELEKNGYINLMR
jgi:gliding motility-associated-like protein